MRGELRDILNNHSYRLVTELYIDVVFLTELVSTRTIKANQKSEIDAKSTNSEKVGKLIDILLYSPDICFEIFLKHLEKANKDLYDLISEDVGKIPPRVLPPEPIAKDANTILTPTTPRFQKQLSTSTFLKGITSLNTELYIVETNSPYIYVYDIDTLDHRRKIRVEGLIDAWDIVADANVFYVSERNAKLIHRIQLSDETSSHWSVNSSELTMSINKRGNVVVSCWDLNKIIEYTTTGNSVRAIQVNALNIYIAGLKHAIQLDDDRFLICSTTTYHRVCIIDSKGRMMNSYGGGAGSGIGQMNGPSYLSVDRNGFILVADFNNNRIIQLNTSLEFIREFIPGSVGLKTPLRMHLHEETRRLYIAEFNGKHITIADL